jgi:hypothetical protein
VKNNEELGNAYFGNKVASGEKEKL